ncbi:MAG: putative toxin-antitoxin system toxin component, PIN family [Verrucomicrobiaceae bacterium]|nr:MAG: putative toxin-antitoxin system toxin component, PIN family [Verrucomicrobiaceae bacterium]
MSIPLWVIDTNVLISAALTPGGICDQLLQHAVAGHFVPAWDNSLLAEYRDVLSRPGFGFSRAVIRELLAAFPQSGFRQGITTSVKLPDPDDIPFVAVALATEDRTIITGNSRHFPRSTVNAVRILSPREALDVLSDI